MCKSDVERKRLVSSIFSSIYVMINKLSPKVLWLFCVCFKGESEYNVHKRGRKGKGHQNGLWPIRLSECQQPAVNTVA